MVVVTAPADAPNALETTEVSNLLEAIYRHYHFDFRQYALASLGRRLRWALVQFKYSSIAELERAVVRDTGLFTELLQYLTMQVSEMFRDPPFFKAFRERITPVLATYPSLRIWIPGCSSGEEVYSFAILLREQGLLERTMIYATDINGRALEKAEAGIYPITRIAGFTENHRASGSSHSLSEYYSAAYGSAIFDRSLRTRILFSDHSLATDNVFAEMHAVSCRNVLIYFNRELQNRALSLMREALTRRGFLGLGGRETLEFSNEKAAFEQVQEKLQWYRKR